MGGLSSLPVIDPLSDPLPPAFDPWFEARFPDVRKDAARAVLEMAVEGKTVPFIARYRKERAFGLDESQVRRVLEAKAAFLRVLSRQRIIVESIERHATLEPSLRERILSTFDADALEDLYHPYRQQRKNRALAAREAGLEPLANWIWDCGHGQAVPQEGQTLELWAYTFRNPDKGVAEARGAIEGARDILVERLAGDPDLRAMARKAYLESGWLRSTRTEKAKPQGRFDAYFDFQEKVETLREPAQASRYLALRRGQSEGELQLAVIGPPDDPEFESRLVAAFEASACSVGDSPGAEVLRHAGRIAFKNDVRTAIENEVHRVLKDAADEAIARAFAETVRHPLLEAPFGPHPVIAIDPAARGPSALAVVAGDGAFVTSASLALDTDEGKAAAREVLTRLVAAQGVAAVAVGDGARGRDVEIFVRAGLREGGTSIPVVLVSEAGLGAYAASEAAKAEHPELDEHVRVAVSIGRRLQDPLAELVKVEPRSLGVGAHHHEVSHATLQRALDAVVESCLCLVGIDVNLASRAHLLRLPGLSSALAGAIVEHRARNGRFRSRSQLGGVAGMGPLAFEQSAGFLRVKGGDHPLDATAIHPERYSALEAHAARLGKGVADLLGPGAGLVREGGALEAELGKATLEDVQRELETAGRDPRPPFVPFAFREDLRRLEDLSPGMTCPGIVSNVTSFGAFVDIGVRHDGLVHVSQLGTRAGASPGTALRPGERVEVRVLKIDLEKKQISLTMRKPAPARPPAARPPGRKDAPRAASARKPEADKARRGSDTRPAPADGSARPPRAPLPDRPRASRAPSRGGPPAPRRSEPRKEAFNNPFAVLAALKVPPKGTKG
jgi:uncharacterized protein